jgi:class 3 adenylate cyclase
VGDGEAPPDSQARDGEPRRRRKLSAIMMADISGFSRMMGANEDATIDRVQEFHRQVKVLVERFEGRVVDTAGDSVFGEFDSVVNAVRCACEIQRGEYAESVGAGGLLQTRIGIHLGDVIVEDYRVYGDGVNIAARLEPLAEPGGICISEAVYQQVRNKLDLRVEDLGLRQLKNIEHPIRLYKVPPLRSDLPAATPAPTRPSRREAPTAPFVAELMRPTAVIPLIVGVFLMLSPFLLFSTAGVLPAVGAILVSVIVGLVWGRRSRRGNFLVALGLGIASSAVWTNWSRVTNALFVLGGFIVAAVGVGSRQSSRHGSRDD